MAAAAATQQQGVTCDIPPPSDKQLVIRDKLALVLEVLWALLLTPPCILLSLIRSCLPASAKSLRGKVVLVTGAGRGLGRGLALGFAAEGCQVAVVDINMGNACNVAQEITNAGGVAKAYLCNVARVESVKTLREQVVADLGPVDVLVNNAGLIYADGGTEDCAEDDIRAVVDVNLLSHFWTIREFLPTMKERNSGHIVAVASVCSFYGGPGGSAYVATKFGLRGLMEVVRAELQTRPDNSVKTTTVYPYFINTSAQYVDNWHLRFPPMSIERAVEATINGVKMDKVSVVIPWYLQPLMSLGRQLKMKTSSHGEFPPHCDSPSYESLIHGAGGGAHHWVCCKLEINRILVADNFGGNKYPSVDQYFRAHPNFCSQDDPLHEMLFY